MSSTNGLTQNDDTNALEKRRRKFKKWIIHGTVFVVSHLIMTVVFTRVILNYKTPKYRLHSASFNTTFDVIISQASSTNNASFKLKMNAELGVKNANWGAYKYENSTIKFYYRDALVGSAIVPKSRAGFKSTKKIKNVVVDLVSPTGLRKDSELGNELSSGIVSLKSGSRLSGKITILMIFKKRRISNLNCTMDVNINTKQIQNIKCF